jgi:hypothetical protein
MNERTPTLLICTRFGLGVQQEGWFDHRLRLIEAIAAASLANQTSQDFVWAVFVDPGLTAPVRAALERIIAPAGRPIVYDAGPYNTRSTLALIEQLDLSRFHYHLTARIDDDDAWSRDTVERVRAVAGEWLDRHAASRHPGMALTFAHGLEWLMYDMIDVDKRARGEHVVRRQSLRPFSLPWHSMSVFVMTDLGSRLTALSGSHSRIAETLRANGLDLIVRDDESDTWLYARHKQAVSSLQKSSAPARHSNLAELEARFGIDAALVDRYIAAADSFGYAVEKRTIWRRTALKREVQEIADRLADPSLSAEESMRLAQQRADRLGELDRISRHLVEDI